MEELLAGNEMAGNLTLAKELERSRATPSRLPGRDERRRAGSEESRCFRIEKSGKTRDESRTSVWRQLRTRENDATKLCASCRRAVVPRHAMPCAPP